MYTDCPVKSVSNEEVEHVGLSLFECEAETSTHDQISLEASVHASGDHSYLLGNSGSNGQVATPSVGEDDSLKGGNWNVRDGRRQASLQESKITGSKSSRELLVKGEDASELLILVGGGPLQTLPKEIGKDVIPSAPTRHSMPAIAPQQCNSAGGCILHQPRPPIFAHARDSCALRTADLVLSGKLVPDGVLRMLNYESAACFLATQTEPRESSCKLLWKEHGKASCEAQVRLYQETDGGGTYTAYHNYRSVYRGHEETLVDRKHDSECTRNWLPPASNRDLIAQVTRFVCGTGYVHTGISVSYDLLRPAAPFLSRLPDSSFHLHQRILIGDRNPRRFSKPCSLAQLGR
ncbi:hypothetical protein JB92DRAFT_3092882, partial [Gautieria morchelliformis]